MKKLNPVDIKIDASMDADDLGQRIVECFRAVSSDSDVVNLVKIHIGEKMSLQEFQKTIPSMLIKPLRRMGAKNCIFVPIRKDYIEDITIDHIEVIDNELD